MLAIGAEQDLDFGVGETRRVDVVHHPLQLLMDALDPHGERKLCPDCQCCEMCWELCEHCGGEGWAEVDDDDDWAYVTKRTERCGVCWGKGGWWTCGGPCSGGEHLKLCAVCHEKHGPVCSELTLTGAA